MSIRSYQDKNRNEEDGLPKPEVTLAPLRANHSYILNAVANFILNNLYTLASVFILVATIFISTRVFSEKVATWIPIQDRGSDTVFMSQIAGIPKAVEICPGQKNVPTINLLKTNILRIEVAGDLDARLLECISYQSSQEQVDPMILDVSLRTKIMIIQALLTDAGYYHHAVDGDLGSGTESAIISYLNAKGHPSSLRGDPATLLKVLMKEKQAN